MTVPTLHITSLICVRKPVLSLLALALLVSCTDGELATAPTTGPEPAVQANIIDGPDAAEGNENFFFLPPIADREPEEGDENDPDLLRHLSIEICEWTGSECVTPLVAELTANTPPGRGGIRVEEEEEPGHFIANWHTRGAMVSPSTVYRIRVLAGTIQLGHADVVIIENASEARRYDSGDLVPLVEGASLSIKFRVRQDRVEGDPNAPVGTEVPAERFVPNPEDYTEDHPGLPGVPISHNTIVLAFDPETTVAEANAVLGDINAQVVGAIPSPTAALAGILILRLPTPDHRALIGILDELRRDDRVLATVQDVLLGPALVTATGGAHDDWTWRSPLRGGNWGFKHIRAPEMWNLNSGIRKATGDDPSGAVVGVVDAGFADADEHEDLTYDEILTPGVRHEHGMHVAGTIGATHDNDLGVDGLNPWARLVGYADDTGHFATDLFQLRSSWASSMLHGYMSLVRERPEVRVVNMSLGYNWYRSWIDSDLNEDAQEVADNSGVLFALGQAVLESEGFDLPVLTAAAGNESGTDARYSSPMTNAALVQNDRNIIVVEALDADGELADFSSVGGHVSAPGVGVLSTVLPNNYDYMDGTSMAAPHVAGLVSYLYTLDSTLPRPTRADNPILDLILANADDDVGENGSPRINAFATAMDVDRIQGGDRVLRMLLDIDDGTADGNRRTLLNGEGDYLEEDADGDGGLGDGDIDMSDFRRWRDWLLDTEMAVWYAELDGSPDHPKRDANGDGLPSTSNERWFSRGDFNGDRRITLGLTASVPGALGGQVLSDLGMLQSRFVDPNYEADDLYDLVFSADLRVDAASCLSIAPSGGTVRTTLTGSGSDEGTDASFGWFASRDHSPGDPVEIFTQRVARAPDATTIQARTEVLDAGGTVVASTKRDFEVWPASDRSWTPQCATQPGVDLFLAPIQESADPIYESGTVTYSAQAGNRVGSAFSVEEIIVEFRLTGGDATFVSASGACANVSSASPEPVRVLCSFGPLVPGILTPVFDVEIAPVGAPQTLEVTVEVKPGSGFTEVDPSDNAALETTTVDAVDGPTHVYVVNQASDDVSVVDWTTDAVVATIAVGENPFAGHLTPDGSELWVSHALGSVDIVSTATETATVGALQVGGGVYDFAFSPDGGTAYFTRTPTGAVTVVDVASRTVTTTISGLSFPRGIAVMPDGTRAYVPGSGAVYVLDLGTNTLAGTIPLDGNTYHAVAAPDNSAVYVTQQLSSGQGLVRTIDPSTDTVTGPGIAVGFDPYAIELDPSGSVAYVADDNGSLWFVDVGAGSVISSISAPAGSSSRMDRTPDGSRLFLSSYSDPGELTEIDTATRSVSATTGVGAHPVGVAVRK